MSNMIKLKLYTYIIGKWHTAGQWIMCVLCDIPVVSGQPCRVSEAAQGWSSVCAISASQLGQWHQQNRPIIGFEFRNRTFAQLCGFQCGTNANVQFKNSYQNALKTSRGEKWKRSLLTKINTFYVWYHTYVFGMSVGFPNIHSTFNSF